MQCNFSCQSLPFPIFLSEIKYKIPTSKPFSVLRKDRKGSFSSSSSSSSSSSRIRTCRAIHSASICLATTTLTTAGKLSVLLQTGSVCLFAYWIANFVVPEIVLKDLKRKDDNPTDDER